MTILRTFAPLLFPINWNSEHVANSIERVATLRELFQDVLPHLHFKPLDWPIGYGSLDHDALPEFFQPTGLLAIPIDVVEVEYEARQLDLYLFDDALALAVIDFSILTTAEALDDQKISSLVASTLMTVVSPIAKSMVQALNKDRGNLLAPSNYIHFADYQATQLTHAEPLWVARMALLDADTTSPENTRSWRSWGDLPESPSSFQVGSGNSICLGTSPTHVNALRSMLLCQFYLALLWQLKGIFSQRISSFNLRIHHGERLRQSLKVAASIEQQIDHLDHINLQFAQAIYGTQGQRRIFLDLISDAWHLNEQAQTVNELAQLLTRRIQRLANERSAFQNRMIQRLLGIIGTLSVVELFLTITSFSREYPKDDAPGLLDLIALVPLDHMLNMSLLLVAVIIFFVMRYQR